MRLLRKYRRRITLMIVVAAYGVLMVIGGCADFLILFPSTDRQDAMGAIRHVVQWSGGELEVWRARSGAAEEGEMEGYVLGFTGNASRAEWVASESARQWGRRPVEVWAVNYPGYGGSTGPAKLRSIAPSALAAFDDLREHAGDRPIFLAGNSIGAAPALFIASRRDVQGLILQNPPPLRSMILRRFGWWNLWLIAGPIAMQVPADLDALATAPLVGAPAVFLLSDADEIVPIAYQRRVQQAYAGPNRVISLSGLHNDPLDDAALVELDSALDWLWARVTTPTGQ